MNSVKSRLKELDNGKKAGVDKASEFKQKKKKGKTLSNKVVYSITMSNFFSHVFEMILTINNIDEYEYMDSKNGMQRRNIKLNKKFKELSSLDWESKSEIGSLQFRGKLATIYLFHLVKTIDHLIARTYAKQYKGDKRFKVYNMLLDNIIQRSDMLIVGLLTRDFSYAEPLQAMTQIIILANGKDGNLLEMINDSIEFLEKECNDASVNEGVILNNIMKTAYILSTMNTKLKKTPKFIEGDYRSDDETMKKQIGQLGYAIMKAQVKGNNSLFYDLMIQANPKLFTRFPDVNDYPEVCVGCQALYLLMMYVDDPGVTSWIKKMIL